MHDPVLLWQAHGEIGRELVAQCSGPAAAPLVLLEADEATNELAARCCRTERLVVAPDQQPPSPSQTARALEEMLERWGPPGGVVLTPRPGPSAPFHELALEDWRALMEISFLGTIFLLRAVIPLTLAGGGAAIVTLLPADPPVGQHDRHGATANAALRAALEAAVTELSMEPGASGCVWFTLREGLALRSESAAVVPGSARSGSPADQARLCTWLIRERPAGLGGASTHPQPGLW